MAMDADGINWFRKDSHSYLSRQEEKGRNNVDSAVGHVRRKIWDGNLGVEYPLLEGTTPPQVEFQAPKDRIGPIQGMLSLHPMERSPVAVDRMIQAG